jgi:plastocyanin
VVLAPTDTRVAQQKSNGAKTLTSLSLLSSSHLQAAVVGVATILMASPAFAATIKLGGDNGELGFYVSNCLYPRSHRPARAFHGARVDADPYRFCGHVSVEAEFAGFQDCLEYPESIFADFCHFSLNFSSKYFQLTLSLPSFHLTKQPNKITVAKGETVEFVNNKAFPHNVVFDEDNVPAGVNADAISHEDYLNGPGEKVTNKFDTPGTYGYYCEPHQGAGMQGTIIVQ